MISAQTGILVGIATPLAVAAATFIFGSRGGIWRDVFAPVGALITFLAAFEVANAVLSGEVAELSLITLTDGISLTFRVTAAGAVFGCVASGLWIAAALYSTGYMRGNNEKNQTRFAICYALAIHSAMAIAWSGNLLVLFIFYEILTFSTYPLVIHKQTKDALKAGRLYMGMLVGTSVILLLPAIIWVWVEAGTLDFARGGILADNIDPVYAPWLVLLFAFGIGKVALMPMHRWLPAAMIAPTPVSALLHAVAVVKAGAFAILTVMVYIFGIDFLADTDASIWLVWVAAFTILAASVIAAMKDDLKARLAYSTIGQLAYIVLGAALAQTMAAEGGLIHIIMHASAKITLFFCAGAIYVGAHLTKVSELDGLGMRMPFVFIAFSLGALSIIGVPPLGGTWSKFMLMAGAVDAGMALIVAVLAVSSLLNVYYLLEPVFRAFLRPMKKKIDVRAPVLTVIPPVLTAILGIVLFFSIDYLTRFSALMVAP